VVGIGKRLLRNPVRKKRGVLFEKKICHRPLGISRESKRGGGGIPVKQKENLLRWKRKSQKGRNFVQKEETEYRIGIAWITKGGGCGIPYD